MKNKRIWYIILLIPTLVLFLLIYAIPVITVFFTSFCEWKLLIPPHFVGLRNYIELFTQDKDFIVALQNTALWVLLQSTFHVALGVTIAIILSKKIRGWKFIRTSYMLPTIISTAARAMVFLALFNPQYGVINSIIQLFAGPSFQQNWYFDPKTALFTVTTGWLFYAGTIVIMVMAEIVSIPESLIEAARIDGATSLQMDFKITLPLLRNVIGTSVILAATSMLKEFEMIFLTTKGGPYNLTYNLPLYLYKTAIMSNNYGYANAIGTMLIVVGVIVVICINKLFKFNQAD